MSSGRLQTLIDAGLDKPVIPWYIKTEIIGILEVGCSDSLVAKWQINRA